METKKRVIRIVAAVLVLAFAGMAKATIVEVGVATDKPTYLLDEGVTVFVTAYNPNPEPVTLTFSTSMQASYLMDAIYDWKEHHGAYLWATEQEIQPFDTHTWTLTHGAEEMETYPLTVGTHTVVGEVIGYGQSAPVEFEVIPEPTIFLFLVMGIAGIRAKHRNKSHQL